jgi:hypothetical protein
MTSDASRSAASGRIVRGSRDITVSTVIGRLTWGLR